MRSAHQLIIELDNAQPDAANAFIEDLRAHSDLKIIELSSRDASLLMDFLVPVVAETAVVLGAKIVEHFKKEGTSIRLKRGKGHDLVILSSRDLDADHITTLIRDFLDD